MNYFVSDTEIFLLLMNAERLVMLYSLRRGHCEVFGHGFGKPL